MAARASRRRTGRLPGSTARLGAARVTPLGAALRRISTDLAQAGVKFALVGGIAVSERTTPRLLLPAGEIHDEVAPVLDLLFAAAGIEPELVRRGCHRGKNLALLLEQARQRHGRDD